MNQPQNTKPGKGGRVDLTGPVRLMTDDLICAIRDEFLPNQGEQFDCLAFGRRISEIAIEECAKECERIMLYPGGQQESAAHDDVWAAARAIRERA